MRDIDRTSATELQYTNLDKEKTARCEKEKEKDWKKKFLGIFGLWLRNAPKRRER
tara:strand:- start:284 stop:448 length:165 start_codon:yes stop_codon:yes gene_type:complete